jgi:hypothetical protein
MNSPKKHLVFETPGGSYFFTASLTAIQGPHQIKVMLTKKDNSKQTFEWAHSLAGPKPVRKYKEEKKK